MSFSVDLISNIPQAFLKNKRYLISSTSMCPCSVEELLSFKTLQFLRGKIFRKNVCDKITSALCKL